MKYWLLKLRESCEILLVDRVISVEFSDNIYIHTSTTSSCVDGLDSIVEFESLTEAMAAAEMLRQQFNYPPKMRIIGSKVSSVPKQSIPKQSILSSLQTALCSRSPLPSPLSNGV